jgi:hypothetical protein
MISLASSGGSWEKAAGHNSRTSANLILILWRQLQEEVSVFEASREQGPLPLRYRDGEVLMMLRVMCAGALLFAACGCSTTVQQDPNRPGPEREKIIVRPEKRDGEPERPHDR